MTEEASEIKELKFPMLLDEASVDTAGNAARSLAIICAIGGITRVTVVTSNYHLRAPWYFRPYRSYGLTVRFRFCHDRGLFMSEVKRQIFSTLRIMKKRQEVYSSPYLQTLRTTNRSTTRKPRR
jgi:hypothetical protein